MLIIIDNYGIDLEKSNNKFLIRSGEENQQISPHRVDAIHIRKTCNLSTAAILLAAEHNIPILFFNHAGKVKARLWRAHFGSLSTI